MTSEYDHWKEMSVRGNSAAERKPMPTTGHLPMEGNVWTEDDEDDNEGTLMAGIVSSIIGVTLLAILVGYLLSFGV